VQKSTFNGIQQPNTTEGDSARRSPARPCSSSVQDCTENMLLDSQLNINSGGPHKVGQGEKELSIVNNLKNFTENLGDKCGVDSLENSDDMGGNLSINEEAPGGDGGEKKEVAYRTRKTVKWVEKNDLEGTSGTEAHGREENMQKDSMAARMELCNTDLALNAKDSVTTALEAAQGGPRALVQNEVCKNNFSISASGRLMTGPLTLDKASQSRDIGPAQLPESSSLDGPISLADNPKVCSPNLAMKKVLEESFSRQDASMVHGYEACRPVMKALDPVYRGKRSVEERYITDREVDEAKAKKGKLEGGVFIVSDLAVAGQQPRQSP
jgi:hypothetical protein